MSLLRVTLEQWQAFVAVVKEGGYANASEKLHKSQPTLSYLVKKIEQTLNVELLILVGRKSELTPIGKQFYLYAQKLINLAYDIELNADDKLGNAEHRIRLVVDEIFPVNCLMAALKEFSALELKTSIVLTRGILSGPCERLQNNQADIAITFKYPKEFIAEQLLTVTSAPFASKDHNLIKLNRLIDEEDLLPERQIVVLDSNQNQSLDFGWLSSTNIWYVDSLEMKLQMLAHGLGYAWLNEQFVQERQLPLETLPLANGASRSHPLYLAHKNSDNMGQASKFLIEIIKSQSQAFIER